MTDVKKIAVMGATGLQGRGVIDVLLYTKGPIHYEVRPMTRSLRSELALAFKRDYPQLSLVRWQQENGESLRECFEGCYGVFIVSDFVPEAGMSREEWNLAEIALATRCIDAAKAAGIAHIIYPTYPSVFDASNGNINIRYFETGRQISRVIQSSAIPSTILCPGSFYTDLFEPQYSHWEGDTIVFSTPAGPGKRMGWADPGYDIGVSVKAVLEVGPDWMKGLEVPVCGQNISYADMATKFSAVTGTKANYRQCSVDEFSTRVDKDEERRNEIRALGQWLAVAPDDRTCYGTVAMARLLDVEKQLGVKALSWEMFLERTRWKGPVK